MADLIYLAGMLGLCVVTGGLIALCEKLMPRSGGPVRESQGGKP